MLQSTGGQLWQEQHIFRLQRLAVTVIEVGTGSAVGLKPIQNLLGINVSSANVGLVVIALAIVLMVAGSLAFPDRGKSSSA